MTTLAPALALNADAIPLELRERKQWVLWANEQHGDDARKLPYTTTGKLASSTDPATWATFEQCHAVYEANPQRYSGVACVFTRDDPYTGIDLDDCRSEDGELQQWADELIQRLDSYSEISPSGTGIKIWVRAKKPAWARCRNGQQIEVYDRGRYFAMTGHLLGGAPATINDRQDLLDSLCRDWWPDAVPRPQASAPTPKVNGHAPAGDKLMRRAQSYADKAEAVAQGGRNHAAFGLAGNLAAIVDDVGARLPDSDILNLMRGWNTRNGPPLADEELASAVGSALVNGTPRAPKLPSPRITGTRGVHDAASIGFPLTDAGNNVESSESDYVLIPGAHTNDLGEPVEVGSNTFADEAVKRLPFGSAYRRSRVAGELVGEQGERLFSPFTSDRFRLVVDGAMGLGAWRSKPDSESVIRYTSCSRDHAGLILEYIRAVGGVPELITLVNYPIYGPDWRLAVPGFDNGIFYDQPPALADLELERDPQVIRDVLDDLVIDFPWKSEADKENALGLLLTPIIRPALDGNCPMHMLQAPIERCGKTKYAEEVVGGVVLGKPTPALQLSGSDEERDKRVLSLLIRGDTIAHLDNLREFIDSAVLASLLTAATYSGRLLGASTMLSVPNNLTLIGSANNPRATGEIVKRCVPICLQPLSSDPEARTDFKHPDLRAYVQKNRRTVLACLLGMVANWIDAGKPRHTARMGGFEAWSESVGGILSFHGYSAWRANQKQWVRDANPQGEDLLSLVNAWHTEYPGRELASAELAGIAKDRGLFPQCFRGSTDRAHQVAFGSMMSRHVDAPVANWIIRKRGSGSSQRYYLDNSIFDPSGGGEGL